MTDMEGSTQLARSLGPRWATVIEDHNRLLREAIYEAGGIDLRTEGDSFFAVFSTASAAVIAAAAAQRAIAQHAWPEGVAIQVRMGIHAGEGVRGGDEYVGLDVHRTARIASTAQGAQVLLSDTAQALAKDKLPPGTSLRDVGPHRLKDFDGPQRLFQLVLSDMKADFPPSRSQVPPSYQLPHQLTSFVGRSREVLEVQNLLRLNRLVTLTGPGGTGKTRLVMQVAEIVGKDFREGVFLVPLSTILDPELVIPTIATVLGVRDVASRPLSETLIDYLKDRDVLLILDNFEQVIAASPLVGQLLTAAPSLKVIVTSREQLKISGEQQYAVSPLVLPDTDAEASLEELRHVDSVALFVERARLVRPDFQLNESNAHAVVAICVRLDGLPLALELAAARLRLFEPEQLLDHLKQRLTILAGGRDVADRQRTLRNAIDWSHALLAEPEQVLFRRLAVFAGSASFDAVESVCRSEELGLETIDGLSSLFDKSLIRRYADGREARVSLLETIREFAWERLAGASEAEETRKRHAAFFHDLAQRAGADLDNIKQEQWIGRLDRDLDNFREVIRFALETGRAQVGLELSSALTRYWVIRNHVKEWFGYFESLLTDAVSDVSRRARAAALASTAELAAWSGQYSQIEELAHESLSIYRELGDVAGVSSVLTSLGYAKLSTEPQEALLLFRESIDNSSALGRSPVIAGALIGIACVQMRFGNITEAKRKVDEAEALLTGSRDQMGFVPIAMLGLVDRIAGDLTAARRRYRELLTHSNFSTSKLAVGMALDLLSDLDLIEGKVERAVVLAAAREELLESLGGAPSLALVGIPEVLQRAANQLESNRYQKAVARGRAAPIDAIVRLALDV